MTLLSLSDVSKSFGGLTAVDGASFEVREGELLGLAGPNGAGKTVTFDLITGQLAPDAGRITYDGEEITGYSPDEVARTGIGRTFQEVRVYEDLTVRQNLAFAAQRKGIVTTLGSVVPGGGGARTDLAGRADEMLETVELERLADQPAANLSHGQQKILAFAASLMTHPEPELVLLDEPMAGVNPDLTDHLLERITALRDNQNKTFLVVEHDIQTIMDISDTVIGMHNGQILATGKPETVQQDERMIEAYLGGGQV